MRLQTDPTPKELLDSWAGPSPSSPAIRLVRRFLQEVLVLGRVDRLNDYLSPAVLDDVGLTLSACAGRVVTVHYAQIHRVVGRGTVVLAYSEGELGGLPARFYDLFEVEGGRIVAHRDATEFL